MILNRNEKEALWNLFQGGQANGEEMIDAVIAEVVRRLAAGVSVEPAAERRRIRYTWGECWDYRDDEKVPFTVPFNLVVVTPTAPLFTLDQLTTAIATARVQENERCARTLEAIGCQGYADALRALLGKKQS